MRVTNPSWRPVVHSVAAALRGLLAIAICTLQLPAHLAAQSTTPAPLEVKDGITVASAALIWAIPTTLGWHNDLPSCAPCDPAGVPFFDRWAIHQPEVVLSRASDATLIGVALVGWIDLAGEGRAGQSTIVASIESALWAEAIAHLAKGVIGRKRPVLYTEIAPEAADVIRNQRSMPSGHTSTAFALATSYWLSRRKLTKDDKPWMRWALMAGAAGVGVLRVAAGKHHPSDVLIGAGVGVGTAVLCHEIKF